MSEAYTASIAVLIIVLFAWWASLESDVPRMQESKRDLLEMRS